MERTPRRSIAALLCLLVSLVAMGALATARPAWAHARLVSTNPAAEAVLEQPPQRVLLTFSEAVDARVGAVQVYDPSLDRVHTGPAHHVDEPSTMAVRLPSRLPEGTYTVSWRVTSVDSHPISGGFTFSVGAPSQVSTAGTDPTDGAGGQVARTSLRAIRFAGYVGVAVSLGGLVVLLTLWPSGRADRRARRVVWGGWAASVLATVGAFLVHGPYGAGLAMNRALDLAVLSGTAGTSFGRAHLARLVLLAVLGLLMRGWLRANRSRPTDGTGTDSLARASPLPWRSSGLLVLVAAGLAVTWAVVGHARVDTSSWQAVLATVSTALHLIAASVWLGGLTILAASVVVRATASELARVLPRFSILAFCSVVLLVLTGSYQLWREVGVVAAVPTTSYGRLLLVKIACVAALIALGNLARRWIAKRYSGGGIHRVLAPPVQPDPDWSQVGALRRGLVAEAVLGAAVLVVTSIVVSTVPAREAYAPSYSTTVALATGSVRVTVDSAEVGRSTLRVRIRGADRERKGDVGAVHGSLRLPARHIGPLPVNFKESTPGSVQAQVMFPTAGRWSLDLEVALSATRVTTLRVPIPVKEL